MTNWKELIGKRVLVSPYYSRSVFELPVVAVSPTGEYVKLGDFWYGNEEYTLREVLESE